MLIKINLGTNSDYTLTYKLFDNRVAHRIWEMYNDYDNYEFVSRTQFYNWGETESDVQQKLDESIEHIKRLKPEIFVGGDDLNRLHENFPDNVHNESGELRHWLSMFNYHLHHLEDISRYKNRRFLLSTSAGGSGAESLHDSDYDLFSPTRLNNHLYMNYPHVGKHIIELYYDNDIDVPANHIQPTHILKPDLLAWFAKDQVATDQQKFVKKVKRWCLKIAQKLPYDVDDKRLAIGHIPLGKLTHSPDLDAINRNQYIHSIQACK